MKTVDIPDGCPAFVVTGPVCCGEIVTFAGWSSCKRYPILAELTNTYGLFEAGADLIFRLDELEPLTVAAEFVLTTGYEVFGSDPACITYN